MLFESTCKAVQGYIVLAPPAALLVQIGVLSIPLFLLYYELRVSLPNFEMKL